MKTNLDSFFKCDESLEKGGVWFNLDDAGLKGFRVSRFGGKNSPSVKAQLAIHYKPYSRLIEMGAMDAEKEREIMNKVFVNACVHDWKGIEIDKVETPFSKEKAVEMLTGLPDLAEALMTYAQDAANYREEVGNS